MTLIQLLHRVDSVWPLSYLKESGWQSNTNHLVSFDVVCKKSIAVLLFSCSIVCIRFWLDVPSLVRECLRAPRFLPIWTNRYKATKHTQYACKYTCTSTYDINLHFESFVYIRIYAWVFHKTRTWVLWKNTFWGLSAMEKATFLHLWGLCWPSKMGMNQHKQNLCFKTATLVVWTHENKGVAPNWVYNFIFPIQTSIICQKKCMIGQTQLDVGFPSFMFSFFVQVSVQSWCGHKQFETHCNFGKQYAIVCWFFLWFERLENFSNCTVWI